MSLEIRIGEVVRASRERLIPGTVITGLIDYNQVSGLINNFGCKLFMKEEKFAVRFSSPSAERKILIDNTDFRNDKAFWGRIVPQLALVTPADMALMPASSIPQFDRNGLAVLLRYELVSSGRGRIYLVECGFFRKMQAPQAEIFAKERTNRAAMEKVIGQEAAELMFAPPKLSGKI